MLQNYEGMNVRPKRLRFSVDDYYRMADWGMLKHFERTEIIDGELIESMPTGKAHAACVKALAEVLRDLLGKSVTYSVQDPIWLDDFSEPIPDLALLRRSEDFYRQKAPMASDAFIVIEVSDSTLEYDRHKKVPLYAQAGVAEVWIVNLHNSTIERHSQPQDYNYASVIIFGRDETLTSDVLSNLQLKLDLVFVPEYLEA